MATSTCPKCNSTSFELKTNDNVKGTNYKLSFIQCADCGAVVGVLDYYNLGSLIKKFAEKQGFNLDR